MLTRYYRDLLHFCLRKVRDHHAAADLAQESMLRVIGMQQRGQVISEPAALLRQVATRAKIDLDRRAAVRAAEDIDALEEFRQPAGPRDQQPEDACASAQAVQAYLRTIEALPPRCREAFCLHVFDGLPKPEIAERMGVSLSMVKQYITRGKAACASCRDALDGPAGSDGPRP